MKAKKFVGQFLLLVSLIFTISFMFAIYSAGVNAKYHARDTACKSNLKHIGEQITIYRKNNNGQMPNNFMQLKTAYKTAFLCPITSSELKADNKKYANYTEKYTNYTYVYRYLNLPKANDIICWDRKTHTPERPLTVNVPCRNVLLVNGTVKTVGEEEFQSWHLTGTVEEMNGGTYEWVKHNKQPPNTRF